MNREEWLSTAVDELRGYFSKRDYEIPAKVRISCGFPSRGALSKSKTLGECWEMRATLDGIHQIFISPLISDKQTVLEILVHELLHACLPDEVGHKKEFKKGCKALGLEGPVKATRAGKELFTYLEGVMVDEEYPQTALIPLEKEEKTQTTRMKKIACPSDEHEEQVILRGSKKTLDQGLPNCYCGETFEIVGED